MMGLTIGIKLNCRGRYSEKLVICNTLQPLLIYLQEFVIVRQVTSVLKNTE